MWFHLDTSTSIMYQEQTLLCCSHVMGRELLTCQAGHGGVNYTKKPQSPALKIPEINATKFPGIS